MKASHVLIILSLTILSSCQNNTSGDGNNERVSEEQISALEEELFNSQSMRLDKRKALDLVNLYEDFADGNPDDPRSADYLFRAADISINLNRPTKTIALFDKLMGRYPTHEKAPTALFLKGFVMEDQMQDYEGAGEVYELFLEKYPNSSFADDAEMSLKNLGKTPEQLIEEFEMQEKE